MQLPKKEPRPRATWTEIGDLFREPSDPNRRPISAFGQRKQPGTPQKTPSESQGTLNEKRPNDHPRTLRSDAEVADSLFLR